MTASQWKTARKTALRSLKPGDMVRVVKVGSSYSGPDTGEVLATAVVVKVLSGTVRVEWSESGNGTTDFSRDTGKSAGERRWINYPVIDVADAPAIGTN
jgi:hypothetical protein